MRWMGGFESRSAAHLVPVLRCQDAQWQQPFTWRSVSSMSFQSRLTRRKSTCPFRARLIHPRPDRPTKHGIATSSLTVRFRTALFPCGCTYFEQAAGWHEHNTMGVRFSKLSCSCTVDCAKPRAGRNRGNHGARRCAHCSRGRAHGSGAATPDSNASMSTSTTAEHHPRPRPRYRLRISFSSTSHVANRTCLLPCLPVYLRNFHG